MHSRMGGDSLDLSGMINLDQISLDVSGMPQMNLGDMIGSLDLTVKPGGMQKLSESVMEGYQEYVKFHSGSRLFKSGERFYGLPDDG
mgnify:CR=1 FL=1